MFEVTECYPSHTQAGVQEGNPSLACDIPQACLARTGQINDLISFPLLLYIYCTESMS